MKSPSLGAIALAAALTSATMPSVAQQSSSSMTIEERKARLMELCNDPRFGENLINPKNTICEYSLNNGKSWTTATNIAYAVAALLGLGALGAYGTIRLRRRKSNDLEVVKPDNIISDAQQKANEKNKGEVIYQAFDPDKKPDDILERVTRFIQNGNHRSAEIQLDMILGGRPERTDLYIKKLELYFAQAKTEQFEATYLFIVNTVDPLRELIPNYMHELMKDWGREIDPANELYAKKGNPEEGNMLDVLNLLDAGGENELKHTVGTQFNSTYRGGERLALGYSYGGMEYMQDHANTLQTPEKITMIVLDGVSQGDKGVTEQFVQEIGDHLESLSLEEILSDEAITSNFPTNVGATVGKAIIENNLLTVEKIGDIGVLVFDKEGNITLQDIGGGYVPGNWFGVDGEVDLIEGQDIVNAIRDGGFTNVPLFEEDMTKGEFMRTYGRYTKQIGANTTNEKVIKYEYALQDDDVVILATDGVFDNISIETIMDMVQSQSRVDQGVVDILSKLDELAENNENSFGGTYKKDNIGLTIYRHSNTGTVAETALEDLIENPSPAELPVIEDSGLTTELPAIPVIATEREEATVITAEEAIRGELDMEVVAEKLKGNTLAATAIDALISAIPKEEKYKRIALRQKGVATRYGFDISEDQDGGIKFSASKPESIIYYLNEEGQVEQNTEYELSRVISLSTVEGGYMDAVLAPDYQTVKILLTHPEVK